MRKPPVTKTGMYLAILTATMLMNVALVAQKSSAKREPTKFALDCAGGDCPLLIGAPQTSGMRSGSVKLMPGQSVGWHSTGSNEEALVILKGSGVAKIEGRPDVSFHEKELIYIPPATRHNVTNSGADALEYVWVVAPVK
jgi:mannose-6-phosphate isomerase-like protein (cupin superfamily)